MEKAASHLRYELVAAVGVLRDSRSARRLPGTIAALEGRLSRILPLHLPGVAFSPVLDPQAPAAPHAPRGKKEKETVKWSEQRKKLINGS